MNLARCFVALLLIFFLQVSLVKGQTVLGNIVPPSGGVFVPSNNMVFSNDGSVGWIGDPGRDRVLAYDTRSGALVRVLNNVTAPGNLTLSPNGSVVAVVNVGTSSVTLISTRNFQVYQFTSFQPARFAAANNVVFNGDGSRAFIADFEYSNVLVFDPSSGNFLRSIGLVASSHPAQISATPDGRIIAVVTTGAITFASDFIALIDTVSLLPVGVGSVTPRSAGFRAFNNVLFAGNGLGFVPSFSTNTIIVFDPITLSTSTISVGNGPGSLSISPDGKTLAVVNLLSRTVSLINPFNLRVFATVTPSQVGFDDWSLVDFSTNSATGFIASKTTNEVIAFNATNGAVKDRFAVGSEPAFLLSNFARGLLYVVNTRNASISVLGYVLNFPLLRQNSSMFTGIAIANPSSLPVNITLTGYDNRGELFRSPGDTNVRKVTIDASRQLALTGNQVFNINTPLEGWMQAATLDDKIFGFFLVGNNSSTALDGAVAANSLDSNLLFTRALDGGTISGMPATTEVSIVNPGLAQVGLDLRLFDRDGRSVGTATRSLSPLSRVIESLGSLFPNLARPIMGGHIEVTATGGGVVGFELITLSTEIFGLSAQTLTTPAASALYSAQFATGNAGDQFFTELNLVNTGRAAVNATITLIGENGQPLSVAGVTNPISVAVPAKGSLTGRASDLFGFPDEAVDSSLNVGSVIVQAGAGGLFGDVAFGEATQGRFVAGLPLVSQLASDIIFSHVAEGDAGGTKFFTGIALLNPNAASVRATVQVFSNTGATVGRSDLTLPANSRTSQLVRELVPAAAGQVGGFIRLTTDGAGITAYELFGNLPVQFLAAVPPQILR